MENANQDNSDLKLKLSGSEGRITGLEAQLARMEGSKNDLEFKLASLHSTLRRTLGIKPPGEMSGRTPSPSRARSPSPRRRMFGRSRSRSPEKTMEETVDSGDQSLSPSKKMSPSKSMEISGEIDPETVRSALRDFAQSMKEAERERDEAMAKANNLQRALEEMNEEKAHTEQRLQALQKSLGEAEEGELVVFELIKKNFN